MIGPDDLFYPRAAGHYGGDTDVAAASRIESTGKAALIRERVLALMRRHPAGLTADEAATLLNEIPGNVRPRFSEFKALGILRDTGIRRRNEIGNSMRVLALVGGS
jgi:hypothetical protein